MVFGYAFMFFCIFHYALTISSRKYAPFCIPLWGEVGRGDLLEYLIFLKHRPPPSFLAIFYMHQVNNWGFLEQQHMYNEKQAMILLILSIEATYIVVVTGDDLV